MNRVIISTALNGLDSRHVRETEVFAPALMQTGPERSKNVKIKRLMIIAVAAALVLAMGAAAYASGFFALRDLSVERVPGDPSLVFNTSSYAGSTAYQAGVEWNKIIEENIYKPEWSEEEALDELLKKYGLKLPKWKESVGSISEFYDFLGIEGFLPEEGEDEIAPIGLTYYQGGCISGTATVLTESGKNLNFDLYRYVDGYFIRSHSLIAETSLEEWRYTRQDGAEVVIGIGPNKSFMCTELENSFVLIFIRSGSENSDPNKNSYYYPTVDRAELEAFAESIDFAVLDSLDK